MAPMGKGTYGKKIGRPTKKTRQGEFQNRNEIGGSAAKAMRQATLDLLKKKKKK